ncbi:MAG TPA: hypothetical protein VNP20_06935, partial [Nocardioidaceae bacterium]|nr:hypothetical protein [Nocardioidaceae bacterium]
MSGYTRAHFGATVRNGFSDRRDRNSIIENKSLYATGALETRSLGHPDFEHLPVGAKRTAPMVAAFLDLTNFTGRT